MVVLDLKLWLGPRPVSSQFEVCNTENFFYVHYTYIDVMRLYEMRFSLQIPVLLNLVKSRMLFSY